MKLIPNSNITLYKDVDIDNDEQLVFSSLAQQQAYFQSKVMQGGSYAACSYIRKTGALRVELEMGIVTQCNYLSFRNTANIPGGGINVFDGKTIYARITNYEYVNNECTEITYAIDYWQTWMFDVTFQDMYIEREHLSQADWNKAETNPYDPSILEFKTMETLPVSEDIEKPYYSLGTSASDDGIYCAQAIADTLHLGNDDGILIVFSDVSLSNADGQDGPGPNSPSGQLLTKIYSAVYDSVTITSTSSGYVTTLGNKRNDTSCFKISQSVRKYFNSQYATVGYIDGASVWSNNSIGSMTPLANNKILTPVSYVFIAGGNFNGYERVSDLLDWFTDNDALDAILGIYAVSDGMILYSGTLSSSGTGDPARSLCVNINTAKSQSVVNKKLDLYPFSYFRIMAPNGDVKELRIEDFKDAQDGGNTCKIVLSLDVTEKPSLLVMPANYKCSNASPVRSAVNTNLREGLVFSQFPCLPMSIDAFQMQMAAVANNIIANNTVDYSYSIQQGQLDRYKELTNVGLGAFSGIGSAANQLGYGNVLGIGSLVNAGVNATFAGAQSDLNQLRRENEWSQSEDAYKVKTGNKDNAVFANYQYTKPAYVCNQYHQINGDGIINYNVYSFQDILVMRVSIMPAILAQYDNYFSMYGYTSGRCGIPRVINFSRGVTGNSNLPHWQTLNGKQTTYIKTLDCRVVHSMVPVANSIRDMFNSGVRMIKGDVN